MSDLLKVRQFNVSTAPTCARHEEDRVVFGLVDCPREGFIEGWPSSTYMCDNMSYISPKVDYKVQKHVLDELAIQVQSTPLCTPESNLAVLLKRGWPQPAHSKVPTCFSALSGLRAGIYQEDKKNKGAVSVPIIV